MTAESPSTTDRLAETAPLSDEYLERIRSNAETWREMHDVMPEELMDIDVLLAEVDRARAHEQALLAHNGVLVTEVRFQAERADEQKGLAASLQARLDTAEGRLAHFAAQHQPYDNMFRTCRTCKDGYGEPRPWPCEDALRLDLVGNCPGCAAPTLRGVDRKCPQCDADLGSGVSR